MWVYVGACVFVCFPVRDKNAKKHYIIIMHIYDEWAFRKKGESKNIVVATLRLEKFNNDNEEHNIHL